MDTTHSTVVAGKRLLDYKDVIRETGLGKTTIFAKLKTGELRSVKIGPKTRRVPREWLDEWLEKLKTEAEAEQAAGHQAQA
ncbi:helix-turn-helix transcriptional regulator [Streptosporangium canum]|uniref:helix-turn-helix transcriptional regulator n=1 Tax=Streptosporangium canum TaxID=324952 RepID=UPI003681CC19